LELPCIVKRAAKKERAMLMKTSERWHCTNPACQCEVLVETSGQIEGPNPRCACGEAMKKRYISPALTYLEFLHVEEPVGLKANSPEE
jgi:hypothetical protein